MSDNNVLCHHAWTDAAGFAWIFVLSDGSEDDPKRGPSWTLHWSHPVVRRFLPFDQGPAGTKEFEIARLAAENEALRKELKEASDHGKDAIDDLHNALDLLEQARQLIARLESDLIRAEGELAKLEKERT